MVQKGVMWFRSKVDWWIAVVLCIPPLASMAACVATAIAGGTADLLIAIGVAAAVISLYLGLVLPIEYGFDKEQLIVRCGMVRRRIPYQNITEAIPTRNPLSSPALSLDRLCIRFGPRMFDFILVSPRDRDRFLDELAGKTGLHRRQDRLNID